jgi:uncharacterized repeat protein (TIGR03803 family)
MRKKIISRQYEKAAVAATFAVMFLLGTVPAPRAQAQTLTVLYSFKNPPDGAVPYGRLVRDRAGNLYGTTDQNGAFGYGMVFKVDQRGNETVLHSFTGSPDGADPLAGLVRDKTGNLYGTTAGGGASGYGTVFKVDQRGKETVLYSFTNSPDGAYPYAGLVRDKAGNLYGTTTGGGSSNVGTVFKVDPTGKETVLHSFTYLDGAAPYAPLVRDKAGNLYGTTSYGGSACFPPSGCGTVFKLDTSGKETVLYSFTGSPDGAYPYAGLVRDKAGNLYGTTQEGGSSGYGTVFMVDLTGKETVLYSFTNSPDGAYPFAGLVRDKAGNLYGTTVYGGDSPCLGCGTVFMVDTSGNETVLHNFTNSPDDGAHPYAGLVRDKACNLYGTTINGGFFYFGTVFKLTYCCAQQDQSNAEENDENGGEEQ